jgi:hypothetical protein
MTAQIIHLSAGRVGFNLRRGAHPLLLREQSIDGCASQGVDWQHTYSWLQFVRPRSRI